MVEPAVVNPRPMSTGVPDGVTWYLYQWTCAKSIIVVSFNVDPMAGTGVGVGPDNVGLAAGDVLLLLVVVQPASATVAKITNTNKRFPDLKFKTYPPLLEQMAV